MKSLSAWARDLRDSQREKYRREGAERVLKLLPEPQRQEVSRKLDAQEKNKQD